MPTHAEMATRIVTTYEHHLIELTKAYGGGWAGLAKASNACRVGLVHDVTQALAAASMTVSPPLGLAPGPVQPVMVSLDDFPVQPKAEKKKPATKSYSFQKRPAPNRDELQTLLNEGYSISRLTTHYRAKAHVIKRWFDELKINYVSPQQVSQKAPATEREVHDEASAIGLYGDGMPGSDTDPSMQLR